MFKELLPIGTVITLQGGVKKIMIIGIKVALEDSPENYYDYMGVFYPEGFIGDKSSFLFNHNDINDVIFIGYDNPERQNFIKFLDEEFNKHGEEAEE